MKITITPDALKCFQTEWGFAPGDYIRLFVRYGGHSTVQDSFSMGVSKEQPKEIAVFAVEQGITFYIEKEDSWYLNGKDLTVDLQKKTEEIVFLVS